VFVSTEWEGERVPVCLVHAAALRCCS